MVRFPRHTLALVSMVLFGVTACSTTAPRDEPDAEPFSSSPPAAPKVSLPPTPGADCDSAQTADEESPPPDTLMLGPLWIANGLAWENSSFSEWIGENPTQEQGWYFLKAGVGLPPNRSVRVSVGPTSEVKLVVGGSRYRRVTYVSCADSQGWWVGGLALRKQSACAVFTVRTDTGETRRQTVPIFRTCPS
ncbi:hypothetical protein GCM10027062_33400 [Nocardioides hungaricus]